MTVTRMGNGVARFCRSVSEADYVPHFASVVAVLVLSAGFMKNAYLARVDGLDYIYYAVAMAASASPSLMFKLMALKFGTPTEEKK